MTPCPRCSCLQGPMSRIQKLYTSYKPFAVQKSNVKGYLLTQSSLSWLRYWSCYILLSLMARCTALRQAFYEPTPCINNIIWHADHLQSRKLTLRAIFWHKVASCGSDIARVTFPWIWWRDVLLWGKVFTGTNIMHSKVLFCMQTIRNPESQRRGLSFGTI